MFGGVFLAVWIASEFNAEFKFAFVYLAGPVLLLCYVAAFTIYRSWARRAKWWSLIVLPTISGALIILGSGGYIGLLNTVIGEQVPIVIEGRVVAMDYGSSWRRRKGPPVVDIEIRNAASVDTIRIQISMDEYRELKIGDYYSREMTRGGLGFVYEKRW